MSQAATEKFNPGDIILCKAEASLNYNITNAYHIYKIIETDATCAPGHLLIELIDTEFVGIDGVSIQFTVLAEDFYTPTHQQLNIYFTETLKKLRKEFNLSYDT